MHAGAAAPVRQLDVHPVRVPTDGPGGVEEDGTLRWDSTTVLVVQMHAAGEVGTGYTYGAGALAPFIADTLGPAVLGADALAPGAACERMSAAIRNAGRSGLGAMAVAAVDIAMWDLAARLHGIALTRLLPAYRDRIPVYGSGGFTNYPLDRLVDQLAGWVADGIPRVKLKTSREPGSDPDRLAAVRAAVGPSAQLFADANGALSRKQALYWAQRFAGEWDVSWFEEPVGSEDRAGLRLLRDTGPAGMDIAAGEYGYLLGDFADLLEAGAVDCLQADVTRCCGITGLLQVGALCAAHRIDLSGHCAPAVSAHAFCAVPRLRHLEYFHDHVRIERLLFDGAGSVSGGLLCPDTSTPGLGLRVRWPDLERHRAGQARSVC